MATNVSVRLAAVRASTAALVDGLEAEQWSDTDMTAPSLLPGWTRAHLLTHVARNADGIAATLAASLRGEQVVRYPNGHSGRDADIEAGAGRPAVAVLADVRESADRLDRVFGAVADAHGWDAPAEDGKPASSFVTMRWREVEVHRVDTAGGYLPSGWPPDFVEYLLPRLIEAASERTDRPLQVEVAAEGSVTSSLPGSQWQVGDADTERVRVAGPDWAVLAWLTGRPSVVGEALSAAPELAPWA